MLLQIYGRDIMNEAKNHLREAVCEIMTKEWIHQHSQKREFNGQVEEKKEIF